MRKIIINGGKKLQGEVTVSGAKNSVVALIPAIILSDGVVTLDGVPAISDVDNLIEIIEVMGGSVKRDGETLEIDPRGVKDMPMPFGKINSLRASYYFYGSLLGRYGQATVGLPGGCDLGPRPIDLHLKAFEAMAELEELVKTTETTQNTTTIVEVVGAKEAMEKTEYVKRIDPVKEYLIMKDDTIIRFHYIKELQGEIFNKVIVG